MYEIITKPFVISTFHSFAFSSYHYWELKLVPALLRALSISNLNYDATHIKIHFYRGLSFAEPRSSNREKEEKEREEKEEKEGKNLQIAIRCLWDLFD